MFELLAEPTGISPDPRVAEEIFRRSGGNAFFAEELRHAADHGGGAAPDAAGHAAGARLNAGPIGATGAEAVGRRWGPVTHELLAAIAGTDENALMASIDEAVTAHVIVIDGDGYAFRHAAFCEVIYDSLLPAERRKIHASFGKVLTQRPELGGPPERAAHWAAVGDVERALPATIDAAMAAESQHAPAEAQRYWERALDLWPARPEPAAGVRLDRVELLDRAAEAANRSGAVARALEWVDEAIAVVDAKDGRNPGRDRDGQAHRAAHLNQRRGWYLARSGRDDEALAAYERTLSWLAGEPVSSEQTRALAAKGRLLARRGDAAGARRPARRPWPAPSARRPPPRRATPGTPSGWPWRPKGQSTPPSTSSSERQNGRSHGGGRRARLGVHRSPTVAGRRPIAAGKPSTSPFVSLGRPTGPASVEPTAACWSASLREAWWSWASGPRPSDDRGGGRRGPGGIEAIALDVVRGTLDVGRGRFASAAEHLRAAQGFTLGLRDGRLSGLTADGLAELARWTGRFDDERERPSSRGSPGSTTPAMTR